MSKSNHFDTILLPPSAMKALAEYRGEAHPVWHGMRVIESHEAKMPARKHKKRRWMSEAYHRRIQKKWTKRFGCVPCAFLLNADVMLDFIRQMPPIYKRDLSAFSDPTARMAMFI